MCRSSLECRSPVSHWVEAQDPLFSASLSFLTIDVIFPLYPERVMYSENAMQNVFRS